MAQQFPNITSQSGFYYTGTPDYVDVDNTFTAATNFVTFAARAAADGWSNGDTVDIYIKKGDEVYKIWRATWDSANEYLLMSSEEESKGTINDSDAVQITATLTGNGVQTLGRNFSGARIKNASSFAGNTTTGTISWDTEVFDVGGWFDAGSSDTEFVVPSGINYVIATAAVSNTASITGLDTSLRIRKNATDVCYLRAEDNPYGSLLMTTGPLAVTPGDVLDVTQWGSTAHTIGASVSFFAIVAVG